MSAEVITDLSTTLGLLAAFGGCFAWLIHRIDSRIDGLRDELRGEMGILRDELRGEMGGLRDGLRGEMGGLRDGLRGEIGGLRDEIGELRDDVVGLKVAMARVEGRLEGRAEVSAPTGD